ncbi:MAG TPA: GNAT family N-acetyltransferase, partial [Thermoanaerobaculia bacterium]|nr:GNAT family N-acetyltransferase [Thermoanaerobaculia bacterium]
MSATARFQVRHTLSTDFPAIGALSREIYPHSKPWSSEQLASHLRVFPQGQFVAIDSRDGTVAGMAASLIVLWEDYDIQGSWRDFTDSGMFTNHDPSGRTLYGAEVMVMPSCQGMGVGSLLYAARRHLVERLGLARIRAGARLRGYHLHARDMSVEEYVRRVVAGAIWDPTLSFQLKRGFRVIG